MNENRNAPKWERPFCESLFYSGNRELRGGGNIRGAGGNGKRGNNCQCQVSAFAALRGGCWKSKTNFHPIRIYSQFLPWIKQRIVSAGRRS